jgi:hypothetical protein
MSSRDYELYKKGVILSCNDVMATVLLLYEDEGYSPLQIATVDLPYGGREYREKSSNGKSKYQRGDLITVRCEVTEQKKGFFDEEAINEFLWMQADDAPSDKSEAIINAYEQEAKFAKIWKEIELKDYAKRQTNSCAQTNEDGKTE